MAPQRSTTNLRLLRLAQQLVVASPTAAAGSSATSKSLTDLHTFRKGSGFSLDFRTTNLDYPYAPYTDEEVAAHVRHIEEFGYTIMENAIEPAVLGEAHQASIDLYEKEGVGKTGARYIEKNDAAGGQSAQFLHNDLLGKDSRYWALTCQENMLKVLRGVLGEDMLLSNCTSRWTRPGCSEQGFHTDDLGWGREIFPRPLKKQISCNAIIATSDFTAGNGATKIFPSSHKWEELPYGLSEGRLLLTGGEMDETGLHPLVNQKSEEWVKKMKPAGSQPIRAEMKAGSVLVWVGGLWHAGGAYSDPEGPDRGAIIYNFCRGVLKVSENTHLMHPPELVAEMPVDCQRLLGYAETGGFNNLGNVNSTHPSRILGAGGEKLRKWQIEHAPPDTYSERQNPVYWTGTDTKKA